MKPRPMIRKSAKWGASALTLLLVAAIIVSGRWYVWWVRPGGLALNVIRGRIAFVDGRSAPAVRPGWTFGRHWDKGRLRWWFDWDRGSSGRGSLPFLAMPLWTLALPSALAAAGAWRLDAIASLRARAGCCRACRYDRHGIDPATPCPECGHGGRLSHCPRCRYDRRGIDAGAPCPECGATAAQTVSTGKLAP